MKRSFGSQSLASQRFATKCRRAGMNRALRRQPIGFGHEKGASRPLGIDAAGAAREERSQAFLAQALHQPAVATCLPWNSGQLPQASPALAW